MDGTQMQSFEIPIKDGVQGLTSTWFGEHKYMGTLFSNVELIAKDPMILYYYSLYLISLISDEQTRLFVESKIKEISDKMKADISSKRELTESDEHHILITSTMKGIGYGTGFMDKFIGMSKDNKLGSTTVDCDHCVYGDIPSIIKNKELSDKEKIEQINAIFVKTEIVEDNTDEPTVEEMYPEE